MCFRNLVHLGLPVLLAFIVLSSNLEGWAQTEEEVESEATRLGGEILDQMLASHLRVMRIGDRIRIDATPSCGKHIGVVLGIFSANERTFRDLSRNDFDFEEAVHSAAAQRLGIDEREKILLVVPELPADLAGIQPGDIVTRINGKKLGRRNRLETLKAKDARSELKLTVDRQGEELELAVQAWMGCAYPSRSWFGNSINAFATKFGKKTGTYVLYGMLDFLDSDDDLAIVLGHELAHLILETGGTRRTEAEADYLGLYLAARAGFDVSGAPDVWDRMGRENPYSTIDWGFYSHPSSPTRATELRATVEEIRLKIERDESLEPQEKP